MFGEKNHTLIYIRKIGRYLSGIAKIQLREIEFVTFRIWSKSMSSFRLRIFYPNKTLYSTGNTGIYSLDIRIQVIVYFSIFTFFSVFARDYTTY